jgi:alpha-galactosidase/6-phospho-beta-glucosidase family protein
MNDVKISLIGAGSANFAMSMVKDIVLTESLAGCTLSLMDINKDRLNAVYAIASKYSEKLGTKIRVEKTVSREESLRDTNFVINTVMAGGHEDQEVMRRIGENHGYYRGLDSAEHNMISDYYTVQGYNQFELILDVAKSVHDIAPDAWFLDAANPVCEVTTLLGRKSGLKNFIGFCHGWKGVLTLARTLDFDMSDVDFQVAGFNHNIFLTRFRYKGTDAYPLVDEWIEKNGERFWKTFSEEYNFQMSRAAADMYNLYGTYPIGDTCRSGTWKYHYNMETKQYWYGPNGGFDSEPGLKHWLNMLEDRTSTILALANEPTSEIIKEFPPVKSSSTMNPEHLIPLIDAVSTDKRQRLVLNIMNKGIIDGIPEDIAVEVNCSVDGKGVHPEKMDPIPKRVLDNVLVPRLMRLEWVMDAYFSGSKNALLEIVYRDPRTRTGEQARELLDEILSLPFNAAMKRHYS